MKRVSREGIPEIEEIIDGISNISEYDIEDVDKFKDYLKSLEKEYLEKIKGKLHTLKPEIETPKFFTVEVAGKLYKNYISKKEKKIFWMFPTIKNHNNHEICPFCEGVFPSNITLEHIIPKNESKGDFRFAILPINLIKCCNECNTSSHSKKSTCSENSEIHPYAESFNIDEYLKIEFIEENMNFIPKVKFEFKNNVFDKRIETFVKNYNLEKTYNHRIRLEYEIIIGELSKFPIPSSKEILINFFDNQKEKYDAYRNDEKFDNINFWIDKNYFGYKICEELLNIDDKIMKIFEVINKKKEKENAPIFLTPDFFEKLNEVKNEEILDRFLKENEEDIKKYYTYLKENKQSLDFPYLYKNDTEKKALLIGILKYYLEKNKNLSSFKENCKNILE